MSLRRCATVDCTSQVREGLRRHGTAADGSELADGRFCWRCRRKQREPKRAAKRPPAVIAQDRRREAADAIAADLERENAREPKARTRDEIDRALTPRRGSLGAGRRRRRRTRRAE